MGGGACKVEVVPKFIRVVGWLGGCLFLMVNPGRMGCGRPIAPAAVHANLFIDAEPKCNLVKVLPFHANPPTDV